RDLVGDLLVLRLELERRGRRERRRLRGRALRERKRRNRHDAAARGDRLLGAAAGGVEIRRLLGLAGGPGEELRTVVGLDRPGALGGVADLRNEALALVADDHVVRAGVELHVVERRVRVPDAALTGE